MENRLKVEAIIFKPNGKPLCGRTNRVTGMEDAIKTSERLKIWAMKKVRVLEIQNNTPYEYDTVISF
jgi:hypothetical protein